MEVTQEMRENVHRAAAEASDNLIYTVVFDLSNELISSGVADSEKILEISTAVINKYIQGGLKVRKKPTPRPKTAKAPSKEKQIDTLTAASRKINNLANNQLWVKHPENDEYSYTTDVRLANGYPTRNNATQKIVGVVTEDSVQSLTVKDAKIALSLGLDVDYDSITQ